MERQGSEEIGRPHDSGIQRKQSVRLSEADESPWWSAVCRPA